MFCNVDVERVSGSAWLATKSHKICKKCASKCCVGYEQHASGVEHVWIKGGASVGFVVSEGSGLHISGTCSGCLYSANR